MSYRSFVRVVLALAFCTLATSSRADDGAYYVGNWHETSFTPGLPGVHVEVTGLNVALQPSNTIGSLSRFTATLHFHLDIGRLQPFSVSTHAEWLHEKEGGFIRMTIMPPGSACSFFLSAARSPDGLYYQVVPPRTGCSAGPLRGMGSSRGYLAK